ncbi:MAG: HD domain-containing protein, partial [Dehalococcoidia bacterium]
TKGHQNSAIYSLVPWTEESEHYFAEEVSDGHNRRTMLKLTGLLHDIAKPQTKKQDETGRTRFLGHSELGATMVQARLSQLRFSSRGISMVSKMVEEHLRPPQIRTRGQWPTPRAIYRYYRDLGEVAIDTVYLAIADYLAARGPELAPDQWANHARMLTHILQSEAQPASTGRVDRLLNGHDLMQHFGLSPGPRIGELLEMIEEARAAGEVSTQEEALALAAEFLNRNHE